MDKNLSSEIPGVEKEVPRVKFQIHRCSSTAASIQDVSIDAASGVDVSAAASVADFETVAADVVAAIAVFVAGALTAVASVANFWSLMFLLQLLQLLLILVIL